MPDAWCYIGCRVCVTVVTFILSGASFRLDFK